MKFAKDTKLVDFNERKEETTNKKDKEWAPATKTARRKVILRKKKSYQKFLNNLVRLVLEDCCAAARAHSCKAPPRSWTGWSSPSRGWTGMGTASFLGMNSLR